MGLKTFAFLVVLLGFSVWSSVAAELDGGGYEYGKPPGCEDGKDCTPPPHKNDTCPPPPHVDENCPPPPCPPPPPPPCPPPPSPPPPPPPCSPPPPPPCSPPPPVCPPPPEHKDEKCPPPPPEHNDEKCPPPPSPTYSSPPYEYKSPPYVYQSPPPVDHNKQCPPPPSPPQCPPPPPVVDCSKCSCNCEACPICPMCNCPPPPPCVCDVDPPKCDCQVKCPEPPKCDPTLNCPEIPKCPEMPKCDPCPEKKCDPCPEKKCPEMPKCDPCPETPKCDPKPDCPKCDPKPECPKCDPCTKSVESFTDADAEAVNSLLDVEYVLQGYYKSAAAGSYKDVTVKRITAEFSAQTSDHISAIKELFKSKASKKPQMNLSKGVFSNVMSAATGGKVDSFEPFASGDNVLLGASLTAPLASSLSASLLSRLQGQEALNLVAGLSSSLSAQNAVVNVLLVERAADTVAKGVTVGDVLVDVSKFQQKLNTLTASAGSNTTVFETASVPFSGSNIAARSPSQVKAMLKELGIFT